MKREKDSTFTTLVGCGGCGGRRETASTTARSRFRNLGLAGTRQKIENSDPIIEKKNGALPYHTGLPDLTLTLLYLCSPPHYENCPRRSALAPRHVHTISSTSRTRWCTILRPTSSTHRRTSTWERTNLRVSDSMQPFWVSFYLLSAEQLPNTCICFLFIQMRT
jgi:hypothetical protein